MVRFGMVAAALAIMASPLLAQESKEDLKKELEQLRKEVDALKSVNSTKEIPAMGKIDMDAMAADESPIMTLFKGTKLSGHVDTAYGFSFNQLHADVNNSGAGIGGGSTTGNNPVRAFDNQDHSFYLHAAQLNLERLATKDMIVGYHLEIAAGHDVALYGSTLDTNGDTSATAIGLQEAWIQILAPLGNGLDIRVGKMATLIGYEVLENTNNLNYSRGVVWGQMEPITATGVRATYSFTEQFSATLGLNNGRNQAAGFQDSDLDHGKAFEVQVMAKPMKDLWIALNMNTGNETFPGGSVFSEKSSNKYYIFNIVAEYKMDKLTLAVNFDQASWQHTNIGNDFGNTRFAQRGLAVYGKYQLTDMFATGARIEYYSDQLGTMIGLTGPADTGNGARVISLTLTEEITVAKNMILRVEFRHDSSNQQIFNRAESGNGVNAKGDNTLAIEALFPF